ncbi:hypothetical protein MKX01_027673 [Papaver californicum]|nr:hypothetical protein MKX01_027673 [Papaver californicum]
MMLMMMMMMITPYNFSIVETGGIYRIHCRHGNQRTGIVVGCYRKLKHNWCLHCVLEEYQRLSGETARRSDMKFINDKSPAAVSSKRGAYSISL